MNIEIHETKVTYNLTNVLLDADDLKLNMKCFITIFSIIRLMMQYKIYWKFYEVILITYLYKREKTPYP